MDSDPSKTRCSWAKGELMIRYHDQEWGRPVHDEAKLIEMFLLEGFQAGLSWAVILSKRENFRKAFSGFDPVKIAQYGEADIQRLMEDAGIVRNRKKIEAAVHNMRILLYLQEEFGSFSRYLWSYAPLGPVEGDGVSCSSPLSDAISKDLKRRGMRFMGSITVYSFLQAVGIVNDHEPQCFCDCKNR